MRTYLLAGAFALVATAASAADITKTSSGYTYFNRPGGDVVAHDADIDACRTIAGRLHQPSPHTTVVAAGGIYGAIGGAIAMAIAQGINDNRAHPTNVENCMVVRGWRVVSVGKAEGDALGALDPKARREKIKDWIGADPPHGDVVRSFGNELANMTPESALMASSNFGNTALSADLAEKPHEAASKPAAALPEMKRSAKPPKPLKAQDMGGVPVGDGLVVVSVAGAGPIILGFERIGPNADTPAWVDGQPGAFVATQAPTHVANAGGGSGSVLAFALPPGRWRLAYEGNGEVAASFCLGSPAFDLAAGDVIYAGSFNPAALGNPDLSVDSVKAVFPSMSGLADRLKPAVYMNGTTGTCSGAYAYALEIPSHPFVGAYAWGSVALQTPPAAQAAAQTAPAQAAQPPAPPAAPAAVAPANRATAPAAPTTSTH